MEDTCLSCACDYKKVKDMNLPAPPSPSVRVPSFYMPIPELELIPEPSPIPGLIPIPELKVKEKTEENIKENVEKKVPIYCFICDDYKCLCSENEYEGLSYVFSACSRPIKQYSRHLYNTASSNIGSSNLKNIRCCAFVGLILDAMFFGRKKTTKRIVEKDAKMDAEKVEDTPAIKNARKIS